MRTIVAVALLSVVGCGELPTAGNDTGSDVETRESASIIGNVWSTDGVTVVIQSAGTYSCNGYTYKMVATYKQEYVYGSNYSWVDTIGDSSAAIDGTVAGGKNVYLSCNVGPGGYPYGFAMYWGNDYYHLKNTSGFYCSLRTSGGLGTITSTVIVDGVFYTAYGFSAAPRGELLIHISSGPTGGFPGNGYCGPMYLLMQL